MTGLVAGGQDPGLAELLGLAEAPSWWSDGLCAQVDPELFFPEKGGATREAKSVCAQCPVRAECLEYALVHDERFGIWGGTSERERRRLRRAADATGGPVGEDVDEGEQLAAENVDQAEDTAVGRAS